MALGLPKDFRFDIFARYAIPVAGGLAAILIAVGLYLSLIGSPPDYQQGDTIRIMYIHVPAAWMSMFCYSVMAGYWGDSKQTARAIDAAGWMHTGDLAILDKDGYCNIVGRVKDMVIRGGENIYPREVEAFFHRHPKIQDAQVFGVPDAKYGEELWIWISLKSGQQATEAEMREYCQGQIAHYKIPRYVRFVNEFPITVTGKIQKFKMREQMIPELGLQEIKTA